MSFDAMRRLALALLLLLPALAPAACGVKSDPELPPGQSDDFPRKYPSAEDT
jgi:predicted small lipoprotein YifL